MAVETMPNPTKKQRINDHQSVVANDFLAGFDDLKVDELADVLAFLPVENIFRLRRLNKKTREAVKKTIIPLTDFRVDSVDEYNAMNVMTTEMPNLQQITLNSPGDGHIIFCDGDFDFEYRHKYNDGEDPDEERTAETAHRRTYDIEIISNFSKLRILTIDCACLNGRYPFLFNSFPLLQKLSIRGCSDLKWDLEMLGGLPSLKELDFECNNRLTGNINSLRVLKDTLEKVTIFNCQNVEGNFMDLADFPHLMELGLIGTAVTGDIRDIGDNDFSAMETFDLPHGVYGGHGSKFQRISDAPDLVRAFYRFYKPRPMLKMRGRWYATLLGDSPDHYESASYRTPPPFDVGFVKAGSRLGYRWATRNGYPCDCPCEVNWLDPEPDRQSSDYGQYIEELQDIESEVGFYRGFHQPPTEEEYRRLLDEHHGE